MHSPSTRRCSWKPWGFHIITDGVLAPRPPGRPGSSSTLWASPSPTGSCSAQKSPRVQNGPGTTRGPPTRASRYLRPGRRSAKRRTYAKQYADQERVHATRGYNREETGMMHPAGGGDASATLPMAISSRGASSAEKTGMMPLLMCHVSLVSPPVSFVVARSSGRPCYSLAFDVRVSVRLQLYTISTGPNVAVMIGSSNICMHAIARRRSRSGRSSRARLAREGGLGQDPPRITLPRPSAAVLCTGS